MLFHFLLAVRARDAGEGSERSAWRAGPPGEGTAQGWGLGSGAGDPPTIKDLLLLLLQCHCAGVYLGSYFHKLHGKREKILIGLQILLWISSNRIGVLNHFQTTGIKNAIQITYVRAGIASIYLEEYD